MYHARSWNVTFLFCYYVFVSLLWIYHYLSQLHLVFVIYCFILLSLFYLLFTFLLHYFVVYSSYLIIWWKNYWYLFVLCYYSGFYINWLLELNLKIFIFIYVFIIPLSPCCDVIGLQVSLIWLITVNL